VPSPPILASPANPRFCNHDLTTLLQGSFKVDLDSRTQLEVRCKVKNLSFSAHADAKGIMQLIKMSQPANVILVHGEKGKMYALHTLPFLDRPPSRSRVFSGNRLSSV
jgi:Cft2 family RNA processing exonuclease